MSENTRPELCELVYNHKYEDALKRMEAGADVNAQDANGRTVLHYLCCPGERRFIMNPDPEDLHYYITQALEHGAEPNVQDINGSTALKFSVEKFDYPELTQTLIDAGADVNLQDVRGDTPLHYVSRYSDRLETSKLLLNAGADPAVQNNIGNTPAMLATDGLKAFIAEEETKVLLKALDEMPQPVSRGAQIRL